MQGAIGKYHISEEISSGAFGRVYRGEDTSRQNYPVAIKFMHASHHVSAVERSSFLQEAQLLTMLRHPQIVPVLDVGIENDVPYLVMEYAPNGSLHDRLKQLAPRPIRMVEALRIISQIGTALQYAHQQNVIHRDLKPANILFNAQDNALLADFGIATMLASSLKSGTVAGTPYYMAPEQFRGTISKESDQYALGCIAYQIMTGRLPFEAPDFFALGYKHMSETPLSPTQLNLLIPYSVEQAIKKAMAKERIERFPDVISFVNALNGTTAPAVSTLVTATTPAPELIVIPPPARPVPITPIPSIEDVPYPVAQSLQSDGEITIRTDNGRKHLSAQNVYELEEHTILSENGKNHLSRQIMHEIEGQPAYTAQADATTIGREFEGQLLSPSSAVSPLISAPPLEEIPLDVLPHISGNAMLQSSAIVYPGGDTNNDHTILSKKHDIQRTGVEEEATFLAGSDSDRRRRIIAEDSADSVNMLTGLATPVSWSAQSVPDRPRRKRRLSSMVLIATIVALLVVLVGGSVLYAMTGTSPVQQVQRVLTLSHLQSIPDPVTANVIITPRHDTLSKTYAINTVTNFFQKTYSQLATTQATGTYSTSAKYATGSIYFKSCEYVAETINAGDYFTVGNYKLILTQGTTLPARTATSCWQNTLKAYAAPAGSGGNMGAGVINQNIRCGQDGYAGDCVYSYSYAFSGGQNAQSYTTVSQSDINLVESEATQNIVQERNNAYSFVAGEVGSQPTLNSITCTQYQSGASHNVGDQASSVTVNTSVTCSATVYDEQGALTRAESLLHASITGTSHEKQVGTISAYLLSSPSYVNGSTVLNIVAKGNEVYAFDSTQLQSLAQLIAGKTIQDAQNILNGQSGVGKAVITLDGGGQTLPKDYKSIAVSTSG